MTVARASILQRPIRARNPMCEESADKEYQAEMARLQAKRERYQHTQSFLKQMLNPSKPEKREFQSAMNDMRNLQLEEKRNMEIQEKKMDQSISTSTFNEGAETTTSASASQQSIARPPVASMYDHNSHHHQPHTQLTTQTHYHDLIQHRRLDAPRPGSARSRAMAKEMLEENKRLAAMRSMEKARNKTQEEEKARIDAMYWDSSSQYYR